MSRDRKRYLYSYRWRKTYSKLWHLIVHHFDPSVYARVAHIFIERYTAALASANATKEEALHFCVALHFRYLGIYVWSGRGSEHIRIQDTSSAS